MKIHPEPGDSRPPGPAALWVAARRARVPGSCHSLTGTGARGRGATVSPAPVVPLSRVAGDTVGLMKGLGIDPAYVSGGSR
ncbi:MAG: hypothetical protein WCP70_12415 [Methanothrix sp.]